jgi:hypothetical protein
MIDFTTTIGVDREHLRELRLSAPTWRQHRPEIFTQPIVVICDWLLSNAEVDEVRQLLKGPEVRTTQPHWQPGLSQREKMLSAFVLIAPFQVKTPWILKLDTDTVALRTDPAWCDEYLIAAQHGERPVLIAHRWSYTKPGSWIGDLNQWAKTQPQLDSTSPLPYDGTSNCVGHRRITSWCAFCAAGWCRDTARLAGDRLPIPSHDTFLWYCAVRQRQLVRRLSMKKFGWTHISYTRMLKSLRKEK